MVTLDVKEANTGGRAPKGLRIGAHISLREGALVFLHRFGWLKLLLLLLPSIVLLTIYLVIPIIMLVVMSFYKSSMFGIVPDFSFDNYRQFTSKAAHRAAYSQFLTERLAAPRAFLEEAVRAQALHV